MARNFDNDIKEYEGVRVCICTSREEYIFDTCYEDNVKVIGYYCSTCNKDWVLGDWNGNTVPNDTKRALQNYHRQTHDCVSHFTRQDADDFVTYVCQRCERQWRLEKVTEDPVGEIEGIFGYTCSACMKEWLIDGVQGVDAECMQKLRYHRHGRERFGEVQQEDGISEVNRFVCAECKKEWLLSCSCEREGQELRETLNRHRGQGCNPRLENRGVIRVKQYACTWTERRSRCRQKWLLKEISLGNHELLRRVREMKALWDHHRETGCLGAIHFLSRTDHEEYGLEAAANNIIGYYCTDCMKEWLSDKWNRNPAPSIEEKVADHHYVPTFKHLRISDTGIRVYWHDVRNKLQRGDHLAWQRCCAYWHHAIVEEVEDYQVTVIEWTTRFCCEKICGCIPAKPRFKVGIYRTRIDRNGCCGRIKELLDGPMYKVVYPEAVKMQNPPELVLFRAHSRLYSTGYNIARDNCEHFATFCKTGSHKCGQISQVGLSCQAWGVKRLVIALIHVILLVGFAEMFEEIFGKGKDYVGLMIIGAVELFYAVLTIRCVYKKDTPRENFSNAKYSHCTTPCTWASCKIIFKSVCMVVGTLLVTLFLISGDHTKKMSKVWRAIYEIVISVAGGLCGSAVGFLLADWLTVCSCCCASCCRGQVQHRDPGLLLSDEEENYQSINN